MQPVSRAVRILVTNLYDVFQSQKGERTDGEVRSALLDADVDLRALSLELPAKVADALGLFADPEGTNRLSVVRLTLGDCLCTTQPVRGTRESPVLGRLALTALGLKLNAGGELVEEPFTV